MVIVSTLRSMENADQGEAYACELLQKGILTREQLADIRWTFHFFDRNGDGSISCDELETALAYLGHEVSQAELKHMIAQVDVNGDGALDFGEFLRAMTEHHFQPPDILTSRHINEELCRRVFAEFDCDGDGFIDATELEKTMTSLGETLSREDIMDMMREADTDGDGKVSFTEFLNVLQ
ncbi:Calmodulin-like protein 12 [Clonorchis sinensis]|uniref:Calmodulin-like protein 12 n=2 Tax=Clonorchis sinensis TaxID=79923 RepID=A0A8T1LVP9_CLOSI|nr:Calmodulin-like protein 12 [Clonorchis sinensis]GAA48456.1 calmodulin [Clonorchis sinensis]